MANATIPGGEFTAVTESGELYISRSEIVDWFAKAASENKKRGLDDVAYLLANIGLFFGSLDD